MKEQALRRAGGGTMLQTIEILARRFAREETGQDLIEYVLLAGLVAVGAGAVIPPLAPSVYRIYSKAISVLARFS
jgi:Flp pilus assembly pilin Flp